MTWSKLGSDRNPSTSWENGAGMEVREVNPQTPTSPVNILPFHFYAPHTWLAREAQVPALPLRVVVFSCDPMDCSTPGFPVLHCLLKFAQTLPVELMMLSSPLILCCHLLLLPSIFSSIRVLSNESALRIRWPKYWSFSFHPSNKCVYLLM